MTDPISMRAREIADRLEHWCMNTGFDGDPTSPPMLALAALREGEAVERRTLELCAAVAERDADWVRFGKAGLEQWDGGPDSARDYRLGICAGRSIAAAIRALTPGGPDGE